MTTTLAALALPEHVAPREAARGGCFHCGEALPAAALELNVAGASQRFCCAGCAAAARWIGAAGLANYYRLRQSDASRVNAKIEDYRAFEHPAVLAEHVRAVAGGCEITVLTAGLRCAACAWLVDRALTGLDGVLGASANAVTGRIRLIWDPQRIGLAEILQRLARLGFAPYLAGGLKREQLRRRERRSDLLRLGVAGLGAMQAMMMAEALVQDGQMAPATRDVLRWVTLLVTTPVVFWAGATFLSGMRRELIARRLGMDTLIGSSVLLAYFASAIQTVRGGPHVWFDAAAMFVFLLLGARHLEAQTRRRASAQVDALARVRPALARRERADGSIEQVALGELQPGDVLRVAAGAALPADGELLDAAASVDEALLTGEATAVAKQAGDALLAGSSCQTTPLRMRVRASGQQTRLSQLVRLVEHAQATRPQLAQLADRVASIFVPSLFALAAVVALVWWQIAPDRVLEITLAVLVVSCPCALSLAIPAALAAASGSLARIGVLPLRADALQVLASCDHVLLDKTGTLTSGRPQLRAVMNFGAGDDAQVLRIAAALQRDSGHPLAHAFAHAADPLLRADAVQVTPGMGVQGRCSGREFRLGRGDFVRARIADDGALWLGDVAEPTAAAAVIPAQAGIQFGEPLPNGPTELNPAQRAHASGGDHSSGPWHDALSEAGFTGIQCSNGREQTWIPACAGMTSKAPPAELTTEVLHPILARFELHDTLRADAAQAVAQLRTLGLTVELLSGDSLQAVAAVASELDLKTARSRQSPQDKLDRVRRLQAQGHRVLMVGDGINDAAVLAGADVSFAMAGGAALAHAAADFVVLGEALLRIPQAIALARRCRQIVRQNLRWAVAYNLVALPLAATGLVAPWLAALGMAGSSLLVSLNALRLTRLAP